MAPFRPANHLSRLVALSRLVVALTASSSCSEIWSGHRLRFLPLSLFPVIWKLSRSPDYYHLHVLCVQNSVSLYANWKQIPCILYLELTRLLQLTILLFLIQSVTIARYVNDVAGKNYFRLCWFAMYSRRQNLVHRRTFNWRSNSVIKLLSELNTNWSMLTIQSDWL